MYLVVETLYLFKILYYLQKKIIWNIISYLWYFSHFKYAYMYLKNDQFNKLKKIY